MTQKGEMSIKKGTFVQFVCDNADFNIDTIDGHNTFHNLKSIQIITPAAGLEDRTPVPRLESYPSETEIVETGQVEIIHYANMLEWVLNR